MGIWKFKLFLYLTVNFQSQKAETKPNEKPSVHTNKTMQKKR